eukprot:GHUV01014345.1.p1 GENE.GHUV01014345.1~~GHUV01014345.1.p1  ORF type:complete len:156 (+),score=15.18 GHUV01014345.1:338-805(+)
MAATLDRCWYCCRSEEKKCRFCDSILDDWKPHLMAGSKVSTPYMRVSFNGGTHKVQVQPGPEGAKAFEKEIRDMLQLPEEQEFDVIFHCRAPGSGEHRMPTVLISGMRTVSHSRCCNAPAITPAAHEPSETAACTLSLLPTASIVDMPLLKPASC